MHLTATHINYYYLCRRKLWLFHHGIHMEHNSDLVHAGKLVEEYSYARRSERNRQLALRAHLDAHTQLLGVIDYFDPEARLIHETKKSDRKEEAHIAQMRFYQLLLKENGIEDCRGIIEYPLLRSSTQVPPLDATTEAQLRQELHTMAQMLRHEQCPPLLQTRWCRQCAYYDYCYIDEAEN